MTASRSPGSTMMETSSSASTSPKRTVTPSRTSLPSGSCLPYGEEIEFTCPLIHVIVVVGFDPLVALGAQEVEKSRIVYVEKGLGDLLFQIVREGATDDPRVALYRVRHLYCADTTLVNLPVLLQVVEYAVLYPAPVYATVGDGLRRGVMATGVGKLPEVRPVVYPRILEHERGVQRARGARSAAEGEVPAPKVRDLLDIAVDGRDDEGVVHRIAGVRVDLRDQRGNVCPLTSLHVGEATVVSEIKFIVDHRLDHGAVASRHCELHLPPELLRKVPTEGLVVRLHALGVLIRDQADP